MDRKVPRIDYVADLSFKDKEIMTMVYMSSTYKTLVESETIYILDIYPKFLFSPIFFSGHIIIQNRVACQPDNTLYK